MKKIILAISILIFLIAVFQQLPKLTSGSFYQNILHAPTEKPIEEKTQSVVYEESVITKVIQESLPSVVTIAIQTTQRSQNSFQLDPFNPNSPFREIPGQQKSIDQNIGSGFIIAENGLIITNKHVVLDSSAEYTVITDNGKEYKVQKIYRDPLNDLSILKIDARGLKPLKLGDSSKLKLGQLAIAIGTPLGEFRNTVTTGIVSGIGRGITAGSPYEGFVEELNNVIQTDAAISPGNSGGPLLNSAGQAIGVNTAIASEGQNIGFAIPINIVKELVDTFNKQGGTFERPYIGVSYEMVDRPTALRLDLVEGAYVQSVVKGSPADLAGIEVDDIITELDGKKLRGDDTLSLAKTILEKKIGDRVTLKVWRDGKTFDVSVILEGYSE